jgi:hypothetical protein
MKVLRVLPVVKCTQGFVQKNIIIGHTVLQNFNV